LLNKLGKLAATAGARRVFLADFRRDFTKRPLDCEVVTMKYSGYLSATSEGLEGILSGGLRVFKTLSISKSQGGGAQWQALSVSQSKPRHPFGLARF
jgi:hypothetical protein